MKLNDCIQNTTALCNPRQNTVSDKIVSETKFSRRQNPVQDDKFIRNKNGQKKMVVDIVSDFQCAFLSFVGPESLIRM